MNRKQIIYLQPSQIIPYDNNPRKNDRAVPYVAESIQKFGFKVPLVLDKNNVIVTGHTRYKAALKLGLTEIPCILADDLTEEQIKAFRLADNKVSEFAIWDTDKLLEELEGLGELEFDMETLGFEPINIDIDSFFQSQPPQPVFAQQQAGSAAPQPVSNQSQNPMQPAGQSSENNEQPKRFIKCPHCGEMIEV